MTRGVGGIIALLGAMTFAELGAMVPRARGQYELLRDAYGPARVPALFGLAEIAVVVGAGSTPRSAGPPS